MTKVQVIQSHRTPLPGAWYRRCVDSVRSWCDANAFAHLMLDDEFFAALPRDLYEKTLNQPVVASDIARLYALQRALAGGFDTVVWFDADTLIFDPDNLHLPAAEFAFGREVWIQVEPSGKLKCYKKIHNAFMCYRRGNPVLEFYLYAAEQLLRRHAGPMAPQLLGPKFLATLHNILEFPVLETAAVLSPVVIRDLLAGGGAALAKFRRESTVQPAAVNLCGSMVVAGELSEADVAGVANILVARPAVLAPGAT